MNSKKKQKGFALVFVIAVVAALSLMTGSMFFYYDTDLKSVSRNSVMQQVNLAAETGLQEVSPTGRLYENFNNLIQKEKDRLQANADIQTTGRNMLGTILGTRR